MPLHPVLTGRLALLDRLDSHPYARLTVGGDDVHGYEHGDALVWTAHGPWGPVAASLGDPDAALEVLGQLADSGTLADTRWLHLPRVPAETAARRLPVVIQDDWDFLWTTTAPEPVLPGEAAVRVLGPEEYPAVDAVLDEALPHSTSRPSDPRIRHWYGISEGDRLVAVAGDRSAHDIGFLAGIGVAADRQGRGYGAALTAAVTRLLLAEYGVCSLGVMADNTGAIRLYQRLGYTNAIARTSVRLTD
ncbi:GNAT family N-acetyltransferase [Catellatospora sp. KI3]|uniref:GNAT family N-acetyltransferase n=1 Tax=Catellatospora sp. KI3 TaxID=3041620 RepID=UPI002482D663|nr:GNAT family N-acetyltransferase [Catellatospora sp. KI3]MDI1462319.1 GNAT family N-acetyltransferase [Catellatospora sp. KI3]